MTTNSRLCLLLVKFWLLLLSLRNIKLLLNVNDWCFVTRYDILSRKITVLLLVFGLPLVFKVENEKVEDIFLSKKDFMMVITGPKVLVFIVSIA